MSIVLIAVLTALLASPEAETPSAKSPEKSRGAAAVSKDSNDPVEKEFRKLMEDDDAAQAEVDNWITENQAFAAKGGGVSDVEMNRRIRQRFEPIRTAYEDFLKKHPDHAKAHVAFGSFLGDLHDEDGAREHLEKALELNARDPAVYNNLANIYGHSGPIKKAFEYYGKAIELNPLEPVYYHNFGTTVYLFRKDAMEYYNITEQQVFDKALELYSKSMKLDPANFPLASDVAQTYYGIKPPRTEEALKAWTNAFRLAHDDIEREGVQVHFARLKMHAGRYAEAQGHLDAITNSMYADLKKRLVKNLTEMESKPSTNAAPASGAGSATNNGADKK